MSAAAMTLTLCVLTASAQVPLPPGVPVAPAPPAVFPAAPPAVPPAAPTPPAPTPPPAQPTVWYLSDAEIGIPIRIAPEVRQQIGGLLLYVSEDLGESWAVRDRAAPEATRFVFKAQKEGPYWFSVAVLTRDGRQDPPDVKSVPPAQRIVIDWSKPDIQGKVERKGDDVYVSWVIKEANPARETFKVEYRSADMPEGQWVPAPAQLPPSGPLVGQTTIRASGPAAVQVRVSLQDMAKNEGSYNCVVPALPGAQVAANTQQGATAPASWKPEGLSGPIPADRLPPGVGDGNAFGNPPPPVGVQSSEVRQPAPVLPPPQPGVPPVAVTHPPTPAPDIARTDPPSSPGGDPVQAPPGAPGLPAVKYTNKPKYQLEFKVTEVGPSGLGGVDVYVTSNDGATWTPSAADSATAILPLGPGGKTGSVTVTLPGEGVVYGYCVVGRNKLHHGRQQPRPGDPPQVRLELNTVPPEARILPEDLKADPARKDCVILNWTTTGRNLTPNPVTLEWAPTPSGPWNYIGPPEHPAKGPYSWQITKEMPPRVYLRIKARDLAGNEASGVSQQPVDIDLVEPVLELLPLK